MVCIVGFIDLTVQRIFEYREGRIIYIKETVLKFEMQTVNVDKILSLQVKRVLVQVDVIHIIPMGCELIQIIIMSMLGQIMVPLKIQRVSPVEVKIQMKNCLNSGQDPMLDPMIPVDPV